MAVIYIYIYSILIKDPNKYLVLEKEFNSLKNNHKVLASSEQKSLERIKDLENENEKLKSNETKIMEENLKIKNEKDIIFSEFKEV